MSGQAKDVELKARVASWMKSAVEGIADAKGEAISLVVREALGEYLVNRGILPPENKPVARKSTTKGKPREKHTILRDVREVSLSIFSDIPAGWPDQRRAVKPKRTVTVPRGKYPSDAFGLDVVGDSMNTAKGKQGPILPGETVVVIPFTTADQAIGKIVAANIDGKTTLKRLVCPAKGDCYLRPESNNPAFAGAMHPLSELEIQGVVIGKL